jgi:hypothetical protein
VPTEPSLKFIAILLILALVAIALSLILLPQGLLPEFI